MSDENILNLSDENKSMIRNNAMVVGFFTIFIMFITELAMFSGHQNMPIVISVVGSVILMLMGIIVAFLHKRDQVAITFMFISLVFMIETFKTMVFPSVSDPVLDLTADVPEHIPSNTLAPVAMVLVMFGLMMLITRNEQKYIAAGIVIPYAVTGAVGEALAGSTMDIGHYVLDAGLIISALIAVYAAIVLSLDNPKLPGYRMLTVDEGCESNDGSPVHFKVSGAILGYSLLAIPMVAYSMHYLGAIDFDIESCTVLDSFCGLLVIVTGLIMLVAGRMRFTPFMFIMLGTVSILSGYLGGQIWLSFIFLMIIGLIVLFRSERRILVGVAIIIYSVSWLLSDAVAAVSIPALSAILNIVPFVILMYVCFALCSDGRLKLC